MDKATHQRDQGAQGVGAREVFMKITDTKQRPGFCFFRAGAKVAFGRTKRRLQEEGLNDPAIRRSRVDEL